jgi:hypothetical protein
LNTVRWNSHCFSKPKPSQHYKLFGQAIQGSGDRRENDQELSTNLVSNSLQRNHLNVPMIGPPFAVEIMISDVKTPLRGLGTGV